MNDIQGTIIVIAAITLIVLLICREVVTWYFKLNKIVNLLESMNLKLRGILEQGDNDDDEDEKTGDMN